MEQITEKQQRILEAIKKHDKNESGVVISKLGSILSMSYYPLEIFIQEMEKQGLVKIKEKDFGSRKRRYVSIIKKDGK